jgi:WD40 repeat protein
MPAISNIVRLFVSSTFTDFHMEREALRTEVFPAVRQLCAARGMQLHVVDLRWGISDDAQRSHDTLRICLTELDRCLETTTRPAVLALLGDRYGWCPPPPRIPAEEFRRIQKVAESAYKRDAALLGEWYERDENAVPVEYRIRANIVTQTSYVAAYDRLMSLLRAASEDAGLDRSAQAKFTASITDQELSRAMGRQSAPGKTLAFIRMIQSLPEDGSAGEFRDRDDLGRLDEKARRALADLKARVRAACLPHVWNYEATWRENTITRQHLPHFCEVVRAALFSIISEDIERRDRREELDIERDAQTHFGVERIEIFHGRRSSLKAIESYLDRPSGRPLIVHGPPGSGKSALLAKAAEDARARSMRGLIIARFAGITPMSSDVQTFLESVGVHILSEFGAKATRRIQTEQELVEAFLGVLSIATDERPLILLLDGIDRLAPTTQSDVWPWIPADLPEHVALVASVATDALPHVHPHLRQHPMLELSGMSAPEAKATLEDRLRSRGRVLQSAQMGVVLDGCKVAAGLPLYVRLAADRAARWTSTDRPSPLPPTTEALVAEQIAWLAGAPNHGSFLVRRALAYIDAGRHGVTEDELIELLSADDEVMREVCERSLLAPRVSRLPDVVWSRLYFDLKDYLAPRAADGSTVLTFYHSVIGAVVSAEFAHERQVHHAHLARLFENQPARFDIGGRSTVNIRKVSEQVFQEVRANLSASAAETLASYAYLDATLAAVGPTGLLQSFDMALSLPHPELTRQALEVLRATVRITAHTLDRDCEQAAAQLTNRLRFVDNEIVVACIREMGDVPGPRFLTDSLSRGTGSLLRTLSGHRGPVMAVAVSRDDRHAVSASEDGTAIVWDLESGRALRRLEGHTNWVWAVAITPDGTTVITGSTDGSLIVWDLHTGEARQQLIGHEGWVKCVAITSDGQRAVSGSKDTTLIVWDLGVGQAAKRLRGHRALIRSVALLPDGGHAITASDDSTLILWDLTKGPLRTFEGHQDAVTSVQLVGDGRFALSASIDANVVLWDVRSGEATDRIDLGRTLWAAMLTPDHRRILAACRDRSVLRLTVQDGQLDVWREHANEVKSLALTSDGLRALTGSNDHSIKIWSVDAPSTGISPAAHSRVVLALAISDAGDVILSGADDGSVCITRARSGWMPQTIAAADGAILDAALTPDGSRAVWVSKDGVIRLWDVAANRLIAETTTVARPTTAYDLPPSGTSIAGKERSVRLLTLASRGGETTPPTPDAIARIVERRAPVAVAIARDGHAVAAASFDTIEVWNHFSDPPLRIAAHGRDVLRLVWLDEQRLLSTGWDGIATVWDARTGARLKDVAGHGMGTYGLAFSLDGRVCISGGDGGNVQAWNPSDDAPATTLGRHESPVLTTAVTADGRTAVSGTQTGELKIWDINRGVTTGACDLHASIFKVIADGLRGRVLVATETPTLFSCDLGSGAITWRFTMDNEVTRLVLSADACIAATGDTSGRLHVMRLT